MNFKIVPVPEQEYEGRQWGYVIEMDGRPFLTATTGSTGDCWNVGESPQYEGDDVGDKLHICDLDEMIGALEALKASDAHKEHVARWSA